MRPRFNIALFLTWTRIAAIPMVVIVFMLPFHWAKPTAAVIFTIAALTDWLDGYLARKLNLMSRFGAFLDPVADKLIVSTALILIVQSDPRVPIAALAAIIIGREIAVSALREWMAGLGTRHRVAVSSYGKLKTIMQMIGLSCMLYAEPVMALPIYEIGVVFLVLAAGLTVWSMFGYVRAAWPARQEGAPLS